jgi:hypothetical protein
VGPPPIDERSRHDAKASPAFTVVSDRREKIILTGFLADCSAVCHAPLSSASLSGAASLFDIVIEMKGHVGGGSGFWRLQGVGGSVKAKLLLHVLHVSIRNRFCAERLLEMSGWARAFHLGLVVHKLESLIMAQNERWRHA